MIRILVVDDHTVAREGLKHMVSDQPDMAVVGEARSAEELPALMRKHPCDVVVLDISMPGRGGLEVLEELRRERPTLPVLVLTMHPEEQWAARAFRLGAAGYLTKESAGEELLKAIRKVVTGGKYVGPALAEKLAAALATERLRPPHETLSDREYQVMCMIASGRSVKEIADQLSRSVKTIEAVRAHILQKMNMRNIAEIVRYAIEHRLVG